nr:electrogenic sodium bicarbonate cotransporter 4-like [Desmodus rotundus]
MEGDKAGAGKLDPATYRRRRQNREDCRSIHIGLSVPSYSPRKRDQKRHHSGRQKGCWGLRPDGSAPELSGLGSRGSSADSSVDHAGRTRMQSPFAS